MKRPAFSIAEMMITLTIFTIVSAVSMSVLYNANRSAKAVQTQIFLYTEAQALMDQIARVVERNTIDYELYYLREVHGETGWDTQNYGYYGQSFIDPGSGGPINEGPYSSVSGYGTYCAGTTDSYPDSGCALPEFSSGDTDMGMHPFESSLGDSRNYNALCNDSSSCTALGIHVQDYLALINSDGDERTVFIAEPTGTGSDQSLSKMEMTGSDSDGDGIEDLWVCSDRYTCTGTDNTPEDSDFMPLSPSTLSVESLYVILSPSEDPYRAFAETEVQVQPQVTIVMTVTLSEDYGANYLGTPPTMTFQRTISTGVYSEVLSYE